MKFLLLLLPILCVFVIPAHATLISIERTETCFIVDCVEMGILARLFDNTHDGWSGAWYHDYGDVADVEDDGWYREKPQYIQHWRHYQQHEITNVTMVDPDANFILNSKSIIITPDSDHIWLNNKDTLKDDRVLSHYKDWYIYKCRTAYTIPDYTLIQDIIQHFREDCVNLPVSYNQHNTTLPVTEYDPRDSPNWQYQQWLKEAQEKNKEYRIYQ